MGYEPPEGITPAEAGTLIDHQAETRDIISTLVDLAVRGYVGIEEREEKKLLGLITSTDYVFHQRSRAEESAPLLAHEERFLAGLFSGSTSSAARPWDDVRATYAEARRAHEAGREMDSDEHRRAPGARTAPRPHGVRAAVGAEEQVLHVLPGIRDGIYENLIQRGYYLQAAGQGEGQLDRPGDRRAGAGAGGRRVRGGGGARVDRGVGAGRGAVASALVLFVFGRVMPARTEEGARAREAALGFREFLSRVESDRYRRMITSPEMFERYLPYAMAFGVEDRWAARVRRPVPRAAGLVQRQRIRTLPRVELHLADEHAVQLRRQHDVVQPQLVRLRRRRVQRGGSGGGGGSGF